MDEWAPGLRGNARARKISVKPSTTYDSARFHRVLLAHLVYHQYDLCRLITLRRGRREGAYLRQCRQGRRGCVRFTQSSHPCRACVITSYYWVRGGGSSSYTDRAETRQEPKFGPLCPSTSTSGVLPRALSVKSLV